MCNKISVILNPPTDPTVFYCTLSSLLTLFWLLFVRELKYDRFVLVYQLTYIPAAIRLLPIVADFCKTHTTTVITHVLFVFIL
jgi:hypothetical protein